MNMNIRSFSSTCVTGMAGALLLTTVAPSFAADKDYKLGLYGTLRPTLEIIDQDATNPGDDDSTVDVQDALSRVGLKGSMELEPGLEGFFQGEWSVDIGDNGDFGRSRRANVGLQGNGHRLLIGKDRPPHYTLIAERMDIYNHRSSPFAYDQVSPFFTDNMVAYRYMKDGVHFEAAGQFNGRQGDDRVDMFNTGIGVERGAWYGAIGYLDMRAAEGNLEGNDNTYIGGTLVFDNGDLFLGVSYQNLDTETMTGFDYDGHTLDVSGAVGLGGGYKVKAGYFDFDDGLEGVASRQHDGYNVTLEKQLKKLRLHIEVLGRNYDFREDSTILSLGLRYDFSVDF